MTDKLQEALVKTLETATIDLREIAKRAGMSYDSLYAYRTGRRMPPPEKLVELCRVILLHQRELTEAVWELADLAEKRLTGWKERLRAEEQPLKKRGK